MNGILVDSNVLLDVLTEDPDWFKWSADALKVIADSNEMFINPVIYSEVSVRFQTIEEIESAIPDFVFGRRAIPWEAAFLAGKCFLKYRRAGGMRTSTLPDFFIGAHAAVENLAILTRDTDHYRTYFPTVRLIAPASRHT
ncbi:MAG: DNA-binding protein [Verrucomicrobia bacterium]|nr:DNA-binding protein [Verrucomicrobiota bacterium]